MHKFYKGILHLFKYFHVIHCIYKDWWIGAKGKSKDLIQNNRLSYLLLYKYLSGLLIVLFVLSKMKHYAKYILVGEILYENYCHKKI